MKYIFTILILLSINLSAQLPENYKELLVQSPGEDITPYLNIIFELAPSDEAYVALIRMIEPQLKAKDWEGAINTLNGYKDYFPNRTEDINSIIEILQRPSETLEELNIGSGVNSLVPEIAPIQTAQYCHTRNYL